MSELQKFENTESWRTKLRNFLLKESHPQEKMSEPFKETNRYSFDISDDLKKLIDEKRKKKMAERAVNDQMAASASAAESNKENEIFNKASIKQEYYMTIDDTLPPVRNEISDDSFEAMELICNKTASDPNSTLFRYLNNDQEIKTAIKKERKGIVAEIKKRSGEHENSQESSVITASGERDPESDAIDQLLKNLRMREKKEMADKSPLKEVEITQIEDIEPPSRFWNNDIILQTSPVKMVGLLRPSTILECAEISDVSSAQTSFKSAMRYPFSENSSSCYETASNTMSFDKEKNEEKPTDSLNLIDLEKIKQEANVESPVKVEKLIDLTIDTDIREELDESEESIIEVLSDDESLNEQHSIALMKFEDVTLNAGNDQTTEHQSIAMMKFEDSSFNVANDQTEHHQSIALMKFEDSTVNAANDQTIEPELLSTSAAGKEHSLHFNDTLEEVEYMMQKGLEYMAGAGITPKQSPFKPQTLPSPRFLAQKKRTFTLSPPLKPERKQAQNEGSFGSQKGSPFQKSPIKCDSRFALNIKPFPKLELFKKPMEASKSTSKTMPRQKDKFAHVISPIGTYIKKTPEARFLAQAKTGDEKNSSVFRELDFDSRRHKPHFGNREAELPKSPNPRSLPKKAYISSEYRQIVDDRNVVTIPGGKSLQKYLDTAILPSVIQHDGKANLPSGSSAASKLPINVKKNGTSSLQVPKPPGTRDGSFANLSVVTGDVSLYTIKDAQKL